MKIQNKLALHLEKFSRYFSLYKNRRFPLEMCSYFQYIKDEEERITQASNPGFGRLGPEHHLAILTLLREL